jgi:DNA polymerase-3 subunit alpha
MESVVPLFKSHYSIGRSILTLEQADSSKLDGPDSIIDIASQNKLERVFIIDDGMGGFLQASINLKEIGVPFHFGMRMIVCDDMDKKDEESLKTSSKIVVLCKNYEGYEQLIKISSLAAKEGFYYRPRIDYKNLEKLWSEDLMLMIPFYDSFLHNNIASYSFCVPKFSFTSPVFSLEDNGLPFDFLIKKQVLDFVAEKFETLNTQSIYYKDKKDFKSYLTFRCINNRSTLNKPNLDHMCSDSFCFENWKEQNGTA